MKVNFIKFNKNIHFTSEEKPKAENPTTEENEEDFFQKNKYLLMAIGTVALGGILYAATRGHSKKPAIPEIKPTHTNSNPINLNDTLNDTSNEIKKTFRELYNEAIKSKQKSIKNELTGKIHHFEYDKDGNLSKETIKQGSEIIGEYEIIGGKSRPLKLKRNNLTIEYKYNADNSAIITINSENKSLIERIIKDENAKPKKIKIKELEYADSERKLLSNEKLYDNNGELYLEKSHKYTDNGKTIYTTRLKNGKTIHNITDVYEKNTSGKYILKEKTITHPDNHTRNIKTDGLTFFITDSNKPNEKLIINKSFINEITHITPDEITNEYKFFRSYYKETYKKDKYGKIQEFTQEKFKDKKSAKNGTPVAIGKGILSEAKEGLFAGGPVIHYIEKNAKGIIREVSEYLPFTFDSFGKPQLGYKISGKKYIDGKLFEELEHTRNNNQIIRTKYQYIDGEKCKIEEDVFDRLNFISEYSLPYGKRNLRPISTYKFDTLYGYATIERDNCLGKKILEKIYYESDGTIREKKLYDKSDGSVNIRSEQTIKFKNGKFLQDNSYNRYRPVTSEILDQPQKSELKKIINETDGVDIVITNEWGNYYLLDKNNKLLKYIQEYEIAPEDFEKWKDVYRFNDDNTLAYEELKHKIPDSLSFAEVVECIRNGLV